MAEDKEKGQERQGGVDHDFVFPSESLCWCGKGLEVVSQEKRQLNIKTESIRILLYMVRRRKLQMHCCVKKEENPDP